MTHTPKTPLSSEERSILENIGDDLAEPFLRNVAEARRTTLHRLFQCFVMENIAGAAEHASWNDGEVRIHLPNGECVGHSFSRRLTSGRFDAPERGGGVRVFSGSRAAERVEAPARLLEIFSGAGFSPEGADVARFLSEVENSAANHALSLAGAERRRKSLVSLARELGVESSLALAREFASRDASFSKLAFFEGFVADGHPLHPCAKLKEGMDAPRYSPEFGSVFDIPLAAVRREVCRESLSDGGSFADALFESRPEVRHAFEKSLEHRGLDPKEYVPLPVHPWQMENTVPKMHAAAMRRGEVVPTPEAKIPARPLMSLRSLAPLGGGHHIKTAINVRLTNAVRTVSRNSVENAAEITRVLREIGSLRSGERSELSILEERAGAYFDPHESSDVLSKNLAAILREDPEGHVGRDEVAMPAAALIAESPLGGPVLAEVAGEFARPRSIRCVEDASVLFFRRYCEISLPGFLVMMTRHGVGLEGHLQNCVPVFRGGEPVRMLARDFGGVRILRERLRGLDVSLHPDSAILAEDVDDLRGKVFYPLFLNHLGELVACFSRALDTGEGVFWKEAALVCREVYRGMKSDFDIREYASSDEDALFAPTMRLKALATMRLLGDVTDYAYAEVPNPLARFGR